MIQILLKHTVIELAISSLFDTIKHNFSSKPIMTRLDTIINDLVMYEHIHVTLEEYALLEEFSVDFDILFFEGDHAAIAECNV